MKIGIAGIGYGGRHNAILPAQGLPHDLFGND